MKIKSKKVLCSECLYVKYKVENNKFLVLSGCKFDDIPEDKGGEPTHMNPASPPDKCPRYQQA